MTKVRYTKANPTIPNLKKANPLDAGFDLAANEAITIQPNETKLVNTGIKAIIPEGYVGLVCSRSGLALKKQVFVLNSPGIVDAFYKGDYSCIITNLGKEPFEIKIGDRIAQLVIIRLADVDMELVSEYEFTQIHSERGTGGFGSSGT